LAVGCVFPAALKRNQVLLRPTVRFEPVCGIVDATALEGSLNELPSGSQIVFIWFRFRWVAALDAFDEFHSKDRLNVTLVDERKYSDNDFKDEDDHNKYKIGHQQALVLHDGTTAAEESNDEDKDASGDAEDSGAEEVQLRRQWRGGVLWHLQPYSDAKNCTTEQPEDDVESKEDELDAWESGELSSSSSNSPSITITPATTKTLAEPLTKPSSEANVSMVFRLNSADMLRNVSAWPDLETGSSINRQTGQGRDGKSETVNNKD